LTVKSRIQRAYAEASSMPPLRTSFIVGAFRFYIPHFGRGQ
jgi:hypothetical protein